MSSLWIAIAAVSAIALVSGLILGFAARRFQVEADPIVERIDALLPQSQCGQCGYPAAAPMPKPSPTAKRSIAVRRAAMR